jgi:hypothetical protein
MRVSKQARILALLLQLIGWVLLIAKGGKTTSYDEWGLESTNLSSRM